MRNLAFLTIVYFTISSGNGQTYRLSKPTVIQQGYQKIISGDSETDSIPFFFESPGNKEFSVSKGLREFLPSGFDSSETIFTMPNKVPDTWSPMPIQVPNPEIQYTILDKRLEGIILDPKKK